MDISEAKKVLTLNKFLLNIVGIWPSKKGSIRFFPFFILITVQCCLQFADLMDFSRGFEYFLSNLTENIVLGLILVKILEYKLNMGRLADLIRDIKTDYSIELYRTEKEQAIFMQYNLLAKIIVYCLTISGAATNILYYLRPFAGYLFTHTNPTGNSSSAFTLPYSIRLFFDLTEAQTYYTIYACEIVTVPLLVCGYVGADCLLVTLALHICGQFSILIIQVENLTHDPQELHNELKTIIIKHHRLIKLFTDMHTAYSTFLMHGVIGITSLTCLGSYNFIATPVLKELLTFVTFTCFMASILSQLYGFCYIGESLRSKNASLCRAFYDFEWYDVPPHHGKLFLMCILRTQKPLELTAGGFFTFSLESFMNVIKTSMAYLSVIRNFV